MDLKMKWSLRQVDYLSFEDEQLWRECAMEARLWADMMRDNSSREAMLRVAKEYDDMAEKKKRNDEARLKYQWESW